jgi:phage repressor protein C with HTH and peptisase S24 domain
MDKFERRRIRLMKLRDERCGGSSAEVARKIGRDPSYVTRMLYAEGKPGKKRIADDMMEVIERAFELPRGWLDETEYSTSGAAEVASSRGPAEPSQDFVPIERVRIKASAGITGWTVEHIHGNGQPVFFRADWLAANGYKPNKLYALKVSGSSMEPGLHEGDLVVINSADSSPRDGDVFVVNYEGEVVIKRMKRDVGQWFLSSDNANKTRYPDKLCDEHAQLIGRVIYKQSERI